ncbi:LuxR C-terminal-related transcriptional regulator [Erwinia sp. ErVv1]|uniref:helix-turn-helix transcriptional regulator n=1 Tax=Erwinia sp. ErVv1 TaxID=1603299 RepID=UPI0008328763|nr:LuxR C-terminal-related transcriptional regulator [Erwinia sp. ErVv1]
MRNEKQPLKIIIFYNTNIFEKAICDFIKKESKNIPVEITICDDYAFLCRQIAGGKIDLLLTEYYFVYKKCSTGEQKYLKDECHNHQVKIMMFLQDTQTPLIGKIIQSGYHALISAQDNVEEFQNALQHLASCRDTVFISKALRSITDDKKRMALSETLTLKEWEVIFLIVQGQSLSEIAAKKNRAISTVATQKHNAMKKLSVSTNGELLKYAYFNGIL